MPNLSAQLCKWIYAQRQRQTQVQVNIAKKIDKNGSITLDSNIHMECHDIVIYLSNTKNVMCYLI